MPDSERILTPFHVVVLKRSIRTWPARTTGRVVGDHGASKLVEISDYQGHELGTVISDFGEEKMLEMGDPTDPLDFPIVHRDKLKLVAKYHRDD